MYVNLITLGIFEQTWTKCPVLLDWTKYFVFGQNVWSVGQNILSMDKIFRPTDKSFFPRTKCFA